MVILHEMIFLVFRLQLVAIQIPAQGIAPEVILSNLFYFQEIYRGLWYEIWLSDLQHFRNSSSIGPTGCYPLDFYPYSISEEFREEMGPWQKYCTKVCLIIWLYPFGQWLWNLDSFSRNGLFSTYKNLECVPVNKISDSTR